MVMDQTRRWGLNTNAACLVDVPPLASPGTTLKRWHDAAWRRQPTTPQFAPPLGCLTQDGLARSIVLMEPEAARRAPSLHVESASGRRYLDLVSRLLQRARQLEPSGGLWEAADFPWWWRRDQHAEPTRQTFWLDQDTPVAAVVFTNWGDYLQLDLLVLARDQAGLGEIVWERALDPLLAMD